MQTKISSQLSGIAGEYLVCAELSRRGYIASLTQRNTQGIDILVASADASRSASIQVKTNQRRRRKWLLTQKAETLSNPRLFYVLVNLPNDAGGSAEFFIVPSAAAARQVREDFQRHLAASPGRGGRPYATDNPMRDLWMRDEQYLGAWDVLGLDATAEAAA